MEMQELKQERHEQKKKSCKLNKLINEPITSHNNRIMNNSYVPAFAELTKLKHLIVVGSSDA